MANSTEGQLKFLQWLTEFYKFSGIYCGCIFSAAAKIRRIRIFGS